MLTSLYCFSIFCAAVVDIIFLAGIEIEEPCHWVNVLHLGSFAMLFGMNIWVMFFAGIILNTYVYKFVCKVKLAQVTTSEGRPLPENIRYYTFPKFLNKY